MPICLEPSEMLCHVVLTTCNSLWALLNTNRLAFQELMQGIRQLIHLAHQQLIPALEHHERNLNTPRICRVYENTRERDCKGAKEGEALRRVRTGADAGLARWETREAQIASFAKKNGWRLRHYSHGFCAIFDKEPSS
jgi:hypothetical protein